MSNQTKKSKFQFGETPDTFKRNVDVINIHGAESTIEFEFIYRTKKQFAALADEGLRASKEKALAEKDKGEDSFLIENISPNFYSEMNEKTSKEGAEYVMKIVKTWDISNPLSVENLIKLEDECAGALQTIATVYAKAINEVRTKN